MVYKREIAQFSCKYAGKVVHLQTNCHENNMFMKQSSHHFRPTVFLHSAFESLIVAFLSGVLLCLSAHAMAQSEKVSFTREEKNALRRLDVVLKDRQLFVDSTQVAIDSLKEMLSGHRYIFSQQDFDRADAMCRMACNFSFNQSAESFNMLAEVAEHLRDSVRLTHARLLRARNLTIAGFYGVGMDSLAHVQDACSTPRLRQIHQLFVGLSYCELSDFNMEGRTSDINEQYGITWLTGSLDNVADRVMADYARGVIAVRRGQMDEAGRHFASALQYVSKDDCYFVSILNTKLGYVFEQLGDYHKALHYYIIASEVNIRHAFREGEALSLLAKLLFYKFGDVDRSSDLLGIAIDNATEYGSRVRINKIGSLMPLFSRQKMAREHESRVLLQWLSGGILALLVALIVMLSRYLQHNKLLNESRRTLKVTNDKLDEANSVKNAYLGIFLNTQSSISQEMSNFALVANQKLKLKKYDDLQRLINDLEQKFNKRQTLSAFDEAINTIFPTFLGDLNTLLRPEYQLEQKKEKELPPMARIFAMIRLGVTDNKEIAKALNYTYNTVLNYRVRVRNMSYNPETFEEDVARISL